MTVIEDFKAMAETLPQIVWTAGPDGILNYTNTRWLEYSGSDEPAAWGNFVHPEDLERVAPLWSQSVKTGVSYEAEFRLRKTDQSYRWHLVRAVPIKDSSGRVTKWLGTNTDIHDHKILLERLELEKEMRERFVSTLTHDLRSPLTAAKMNAQLILRKPQIIESVEKHAQRILASIDRTDEMIRNLLDANLIRAGNRLPMQIEEFSLPALINETLEELTAVHGDRFKIENLPAVTCFSDRQNIQRFVENLCNNAVKFGSSTSDVKINLRFDADVFRISVRNEGAVLSDLELRELFEPYKKSHLARPGTLQGWGLGLTIVKGIVEGLGGSMNVESTPGEGTTFTGIFPVDSRDLAPSDF